MIFANKMCQACVKVVCPKSTHAPWKVCLRKAHPGAFELVLPKTHALPSKDNPFLFIVRPSSTSTWGARCGHHQEWHMNKTHFPPSFRNHLKSLQHRIRPGKKDPPNLPLLILGRGS